LHKIYLVLKNLVLCARSETDGSVLDFCVSKRNVEHRTSNFQRRIMVRLRRLDFIKKMSEDISTHITSRI